MVTTHTPQITPEDRVSSPTEVEVKPKQSPWRWILLGAVLGIVGIAFAIWLLAAVLVLRVNHSTSSVATTNTTIAVSPSVEQSTETTLAPPVTVANAGVDYDTSPCSVQQSAGLTDTKTILQGLMDVRSAGFKTRNKDCFEHVWTSSVHVSEDLANAAFPNSHAEVLGYDGSDQLHSGAQVRFTIRSSGLQYKTVVAVVTQYAGEWRFLSLRAE